MKIVSAGRWMLGAAAVALCLAGQAVAAEPKSGGTFKLVGSGDVAGFDPVSARTAAVFLHRALTRTLVAFPTDADPKVAAQPVADLAEAVPVAEEGGLVYRLTIREGATWNTETPRQITAADAIRGFKRLCNPVQPTGTPTYYIGVIKGFADYCAGFAKVPADVAAIRDYVEGTDVEGLTAEDERTLKITLERPTADFASILALVSSAPVALEMLDHLPNSPELRRNYVSSGPYVIEDYILNESISLARSESWNAAADPIHKAYVDRIEVAFGTPDAGKTQRMIEAGDIDGYFDLSIATADLTRIMTNPGDTQLLQFADGAINPVLVINLASPNNNKALADIRVRQALNYAVNKSAIVQVGGGPAVKQPIGQLLTANVIGHKPYDPYPTPESKGDPEKAKQLLAEAGFPNGIELKYSYAAGGRYDLYSAALQADLAKAGIKLIMQPGPSRTVMSQMYQNRQATNAGAWDLGMTSLRADWVGDSARTMIVPMFHGEACEKSTSNWTCYNNPAVNALIDKALTATDEAVAAESWAQADRAIMADAPVVPLITGKISLYASERMRGTTVNLLFNNVDPTLVWIDE
ncbi:ABC transporter substrate-binding protein [Aminobacter ciceronei]|uniref:Peptide/nickel transport system substrate-binding protein n=1 Tax=Aminobacter ciceronei TaxID=150723 RepID=A0ABR6CA47_9HYPH|nr:ABC transporter substrate-binding protein [Aminobacter ciceronei]MBA8908123.1 peptide/nickel transport system substrate-binding protein [Aminobacter ciceronei]MBA9021893.1 peptide/nickel transport system substrate-binding protein [Aminobacter ciceronei]